jgi:hypothetical protein
LPVGIIVVAFAVIGVSSVADVGYALVFVLTVLGVTRAISASRAGRRWRAQGECRRSPWDCW